MPPLGQAYLDYLAISAATLSMDLDNNGRGPPAWLVEDTAMSLMYQLALGMPCAGLHSVEVVRGEGDTLP